jgi:hypothetical protein
LRVMVARIFRPSKTAMQSGRAKTGQWVLVWDAEEPQAVEPLMGYTSSADMKQEVRLSFDTREEAVAYAERNGIPYEVDVEHDRKRRPISYADNFATGRRSPWTH